MTPNDDFYYKRNSHFAIDHSSLMKCYYPVIGPDAFALYHYFYEFNDGGQSQHKVSQILNHLMVSPTAFSRALDRLMALGLVKVYEEKGHNIFYVEIRQTLSIYEFLKNVVFRNMLEDYIGDYATSLLLDTEETALVDITKTYSEVFKVEEDMSSPNQEVKVEQQQNQFDMNQLKQLMNRDGLVFANEHQDLPKLFSLAEKYQLTWVECYQLAKKTAIQHRISIDRLHTLLNNRTQPTEGLSDFSKQEQVIIKEAKSSNAETFLAKLKTIQKVMITKDEYRLISELQDRGFLDEVINVLVLFSMNRVDSVNLNRNYIEKVANSFSAENIMTAEQAIIYLRGRQMQQAQPKSQEKMKKRKGNNPAWSDPNYVNETSDRRMKELDALRKQTLERLNKGGE